MNQYSLYNEAGYTEDYPLVTTDIPDYGTVATRPVVYKTMDDELYVSCPNGKLLKIISLNGSIQKQIPLVQTETYINIGNLAKGVYVILLESDKERWGYKIVK
jgi:hypothetical protein